MNISRGFRRLSVAAGLAGATFIGFLWANNGMPEPAQFVAATCLFVIAPVVFVLVVGWAIEGFKNSN